jgi:hypothetical protein
MKATEATSGSGLGRTKSLVIAKLAIVCAGMILLACSGEAGFDGPELGEFRPANAGTYRTDDGQPEEQPGISFAVAGEEIARSRSAPSGVEAVLSRYDGQLCAALVEEDAFVENCGGEDSTLEDLLGRRWMVLDDPRCQVVVLVDGEPGAEFATVSLGVNAEALAAVGVLEGRSSVSDFFASSTLPASRFDRAGAEPSSCSVVGFVDHL